MLEMKKLQLRGLGLCGQCLIIIKNRNLFVIRMIWFQR